MIQESKSNYQQQILEEVGRVPEEHRHDLLRIIRTFREEVTLRSAVESFRQGWSEALRGQVHPIDQLWKDVDAE